MLIMSASTTNASAASPSTANPSSSSAASASMQRRTTPVRPDPKSQDGRQQKPHERLKRDDQHRNLSPQKQKQSQQQQPLQQSQPRRTNNVSRQRGSKRVNDENALREDDENDDWNLCDRLIFFKLRPSHNVSHQSTHNNNQTIYNPHSPYNYGKPTSMFRVRFGVKLEEVCNEHNDIPGPLLILILKLNKEAPYKKVSSSPWCLFWRSIDYGCEISLR